MGDFKAVGEAFVSFYYQTVMTNREGLSNLYQNSSLMTFEGIQACGKEAIMTKLMSLSYKSVKYAITTVDCQPLVNIDDNKSVMITVMGQLQTDEDPLQSFVQTFLLRTFEQNYFIANETFRVVLHNLPSERQGQ